MASVTIKGLPDSLYRLIKRSAADHRRSINNEIIFRLERSLKAKPMDPKAFLARVDSLRSRLKLLPLTDEMLKRAKEAGRP
jgi:plasmid stability protein